ncbi:MAG: hypothetical protein R3C05_18605 [Pirellulaceae bacterium]
MMSNRRFLTNGRSPIDTPFPADGLVGDQRATSNTPAIARLVHLTLATLMLCAVGCGDQDTAKTSHFEHDHEVAGHWPADLADAATKLRERLSPSDQSQTTTTHVADEIADIVSWVPEIAADTDLSEEDWIPLDNAARSLSANLRATNNELTISSQTQIAALCELIDQSVGKIPGQTPPTKGSAL